MGNWLRSMHWNWKLFLMNNKIWIAKAADALKRSVIGQIFHIALLNVKDSHLLGVEHANFIIYLDRIAREFLNDRAYLCLDIFIFDYLFNSFINFNFTFAFTN